MVELKRNITIRTMKKVEREFSNDKAWTKNGLVTETNLHSYSVESCLYHLLLENKIRRLQSSSNGELYVKA